MSRWTCSSLPSNSIIMALVFSHKYEVGVQFKHTMSSSSNMAWLCHRPRFIIAPWFSARLSNLGLRPTLRLRALWLRSLERDAFNKKSPKCFPRFKKKGQQDSFRYPQGIKLEGNKVFLPKIGWARFFKSREVLGVIKNATVSKRGKHWFVSIQTEQEIPDQSHRSKSMVGVDVGVTRFATLSDGTVYEPEK